MPADLTISIINHSNPALLRECLRSVYAGAHAITLDVWVVDNATGGAGVTELKTEFADVQWLFNAERLGFSANHNQVLRRTQSRYACILNDDTVIHDGAFDTLVAYLDAHPKVGMAGPKLLNRDGTLQNCTFRFPSLWSELVWMSLLPRPLGFLKQAGSDPAQRGDQPAQVDWLLGACLVVRDSTLSQIGLLDAALSPIAYTEEVDWCYRAHRAGWEVAFCPAAVVTHFGGQSTQNTEPGRDKFQVEMYRTRLAFFRKHYGPLKALLLRGVYLATLPWNTLMLAQSALRRTLPVSQCRSRFATLCGIAGISLRFREAAL